MKFRIFVFATGLLAFLLLFLTMDYFVMGMQGLSLVFEHQQTAVSAAATE